MADEKDKKEMSAETEAAAADKPARAPRKASTKKTASGDAPDTAAADEKATKPATRARKTAKAESAKADTAEAETAEGGAAEAKPEKAAPRKPRAKAARAEPEVAEPSVDDAAATEAPVAEAAAEVAPAKPARRRAAEKPAAAKAKPPAEPKPKAAKPKPAPKAPVHRAPDERVAQVFDADGVAVDEVKLSAERFGLTPDVNLLHLTVRAEQAARRRGTASTKTRGEISGSTAKLYRQKGTGRARAGSVKSPTRSGGGIAFGPKPRSYEIKVNRKAARKALAMALSDRAEGGTIYVARGLELEAPSTAVVNELLVTLDIPAPVLVVTDDEPVVALSVRNLSYAEAGEARALSVEQVLRNRSVVVTEKALSVLTGA